MASFVMALPILPGQAEGISLMRDEALGPRRSEYEESRRRMGITKEQAWVQTTPMGQLVLVYWEVEDPQRALQQMAESQDQFDSWFRQFIQDVHGVDVTREQQPASELVFDWEAS
jgi:hypothetical protein